MNKPQQNSNETSILSQTAALFKESWQLTNGIKLLFFALGILLPIGIALLYFLPIIFLSSTLFSLADIATATISTLLSFFIAFILLNYSLFTISNLMIILGIRRAIGLAPKLTTICLQYLRHSGRILLIFFILLFIEYSGELLNLFFPGRKVSIPLVGTTIYSVLCFAVQGFTIPLIITKRYGVFAALKQTGSILYNNGLILIVCLLLMGIILTISAIPLGIGLFWTLPMAMILMGILFRNTTGLMKRN
ncbi:hypothetical protein [Legionella rowbothamii]|uniref:hypothetical protein n=1 Tax=Legionella rowbothamii TaxID=96229 RepID=UPI0010555A22|nr:hypothetical protein [Legionella rowbothamii]